MAHTQLEKYIRDARAQGASDDAIRAELLKVGWPADAVNDALAPKSAPAAPSLPPPPPPQFGMWVTFQYAVSFICLYIVSVALASLLDTFVDRWFGPASAYSGGNYSYASGIQLQLASLIVAFPLFIWLFVVLREKLARNPGLRALTLRKRLIYITLFIAAILIIGDLIWNIYDILSGNFTTTGFGHLVVLLLISGSVFFYLLSDVKEDRTRA